MKTTLKMTLLTLLVLALVPGSVLAGSGARHRMEGAIIGAGAALLGAAILSGSVHYAAPPPPPPPAYRGYGRRHARFTPPAMVWVPPVYEERWIPGHEDRWGRWVPPQRIRVLVREGFWTRRGPDHHRRSDR